MTDKTISIIGLIISLIGLIISIRTLCLAGTIKKAVQNEQSKILFNHKIDDILSKLKQYNSYFSLNATKLKEREVKDLFNNINSTLIILSPTIPTQCNSIYDIAIARVKNGYKAKFVKSKDIKIKWWNIYRKLTSNNIDIDYIWEVHRNINTLIDLLEDFKINKDITK